MASGVDQGGDDGALRFDEIVDGQIALGHEGAAVVVEFYRKGFGVQPDAVGGRELAVQQLVSAARAPGGKVVISCRISSLTTASATTGNFFTSVGEWSVSAPPSSGSVFRHVYRRRGDPGAGFGDSSGRAVSPRRLSPTTRRQSSDERAARAAGGRENSRASWRNRGWGRN